MSSACVCHTDEWCFYCEMHLPLEDKLNEANRRIEALQDERDAYKEALKEAKEDFKVILALRESTSEVEAWAKGGIEDIEDCLSFLSKEVQHETS